MTQHNRAPTHKRTVIIYDPGTIVVTSDKAPITTMRTPVRSLRSAIKWKRERRRDRHSRSLFESANLRLRRAPEWSDHSVILAPPGIGKAPLLGTAPPPPEDRGPSATYTWRTTEQCAWWEKIPARTAALAYIATVLAAVASGWALIARGDVR
jgi:hypothetical protein